MGAVGTTSGSVGSSNETKFVNDMIKSATSAIPINEVPNPSDLMSNGDVQSAVEAYVMQFGGDENAILDKIRDGIEKQLGGVKNISFTDMMKQASNTQHTISFDKTATMITSPKGSQIGKIDTVKKGDLGSLIEKSGAKELVVNMYRDKSGANDLKRLQNLGFEIKSQTLGTASAGSNIPPRDYYYMVKKK